MSTQLTNAAKTTMVANGTIPVDLIVSGAEMILEVISGLIEKRRMLKQRITDLEGICKTQAKQMVVFENALIAHGIMPPKL